MAALMQQGGRLCAHQADVFQAIEQLGEFLFLVSAQAISLLTAGERAEPSVGALGQCAARCLPETLIIERGEPSQFARQFPRKVVHRRQRCGALRRRVAQAARTGSRGGSA